MLDQLWCYMLKKGNVYRHKNKLWIYVGFKFSVDYKGIKSENFVQYLFIPANKTKITQRDTVHYQRGVYKFMKYDRAATALFGRAENDLQLTKVLTGKYDYDPYTELRMGTPIAWNSNYDITHIWKFTKGNIKYVDIDSVVIARDSMCATPDQN